MIFVTEDPLETKVKYFVLKVSKQDVWTLSKCLNNLFSK